VASAVAHSVSRSSLLARREPLDFLMESWDGKRCMNRSPSIFLVLFFASGVKFNG